MHTTDLWFDACAKHMAHLARPASCRPPFVLDGDTDDVLVVCAPWRYSVFGFAQEVRVSLRRPRPTVVALTPPFEHADGGHEWFAYTTTSTTAAPATLMTRLDLDADDAELQASLQAVARFVASLPDHVHVDLFGSSQGGVVAAHVAVALPRVRRAVAFQPAGFYAKHWRPHSTVQVLVHVEEAAHGHLWTWRGRLGRKRLNWTVLTLFFGTNDTVAPPALVELI